MITGLDGRALSKLGKSLEGAEVKIIQFDMTGTCTPVSGETVDTNLSVTVSGGKLHLYTEGFDIGVEELNKLLTIAKVLDAMNTE